MTVLDSLRNNMRELSQPLRDQLATINARLLEVDKERDELLAARRHLTKLLTQLNGELSSTKPGPKSQADTYARRKDVSPEVVAGVRDLIQAHRDELADGFTAVDVKRLADANNVKPVLSTDRYRGAVEKLHHDGVVRLDRRIKGGANLWKLVG